MGTAGEYEDEIRKFRSHKELMVLWKKVYSANAAGIWAGGKGFEYVILRAFEIEGAKVTYSYSVPNQEVTMTGGTQTFEQIDGALHLDGLSFLVECKDHSENIDGETIAKLRSQLLRRPGGVVGVIFSRTEFTRGASIVARFTAPQSILLWRGIEIDVALRRKTLCRDILAKYRYCAEMSAPDLNICKYGDRRHEVQEKNSHRR